MDLHKLLHLMVNRTNAKDIPMTYIFIMLYFDESRKGNAQIWVD